MGANHGRGFLFCPLALSRPALVARYPHHETAAADGTNNRPMPTDVAPIATEAGEVVIDQIAERADCRAGHPWQVNMRPSVGKSGTAVVPSTKSV